MYDNAPPFAVTASILSRITRIAELIGQTGNLSSDPMQEQLNRIRSVHASLALDHGGLSLELAASVLTGKLTPGPDPDITKLKNMDTCCRTRQILDPYALEDLTLAYTILSEGLPEHTGQFRTGPIWVLDNRGAVLHYGLPPEQIPEAITQLLDWVRSSDYPMLLKSCVFHYELERIQPFPHSNGILARLWQVLLLTRWKELFAKIPLESVLLDRQEEYYAAIHRSNRERTASAFADFMLSALEEALLEAAQPLASFDAISTAALRWYKISRLLKKNGTITNADVRELFQVSAATANRILAGFTAEGKLKKQRLGKSWGYVAV